MNIHFDTPPAGGQQSNGLAVRYAAAKREVPRWRWYLMLLLISVPVLYFAGPLLVALWWHTAPGVILLQVATIKAPTDGQVARLVKEGDTVQAGAALATIERPRVASSVSMGQPLPLNLPPTGAGPMAGMDGQAALLDEAISLAQNDVAFRRERLRTLQGLMRERASTRAEVDAARAALVQAEATLIRARLDQANQRQQWRQASFAQSGASSTSLSARGMPSMTVAGPLASAPAASSPAEVPLSAGSAALHDAGMMVATSPFAGKVTAVLAVPGENVTSSSELLVVQGEGLPVIEAYVPPADADVARKGRQATLRFFDGGRMKAEVVDVQTQAAKVPADRVGPLSPRSQAIVVRLKALEPLPVKYRIHELPLNVRFDWAPPWRS